MSDILFDVLYEMIGFTGRVLVFICTLGKARVETGAWRELVGPKFGIDRMPDGKWLLGAGWGRVFGMIFWFCALLGIFLYSSVA